MTPYKLTVDAQTMQGLFTRDEALAGLVEQIVQQVLEAQVTDYLQAQPYERTTERQGYRNGYKPRCLTTRVGTLELRVPQVRQGEFCTDLFLRFQRSERAFGAGPDGDGGAGGLHPQGNQDHRGTVWRGGVQEHGLRVVRAAGPLVKDWNERPLGETAYPFLVVDALALKIREDERVRARSALIVTGVAVSGHRQILGLQLGDSASEASWGALFQSLKQRGLRGVDLVVSDDHSGLVGAARRHFQGCTAAALPGSLLPQRARRHPQGPPEGPQDAPHRAVHRPDLPTARALLRQMHSQFADRAPTALEILDTGFDDATAVLALPAPYRVRLRTTNSQERKSEEIRRRERVIRIFPNRAAAVRLFGALLIEWDEQWATGKRYLDMNLYLQWKQHHDHPSPPSLEEKEVPMQVA